MWRWWRTQRMVLLPPFRMVAGEVGKSGQVWAIFEGRANRLCWKLGCRAWKERSTGCLQGFGPEYSGVWGMLFAEMPDSKRGAGLFFPRRGKVRFSLTWSFGPKGIAGYLLAKYTLSGANPEMNKSFLTSFLLKPEMSEPSDHRVFPLISVFFSFSFFISGERELQKMTSQARAVSLQAELSWKSRSPNS